MTHDTISNPHWSIVCLQSVKECINACEPTNIAKSCEPILLGSRSSQSFIDAVCDSWNRESVPLLVPQECQMDGLPAISYPPLGALVGFLTSGTTRLRPSVVWKTKSQLISECHVLRDVLNLEHGATLLSMASPAHIYGFLYGILLPALFDLEVTMACQWNAKIVKELVSAPISRADFVVLVPQLWPFVASRLLEHRHVTVISSGDRFQDSHVRLAQELASKGLNKLRVLDILGSTETGGIGFRTIAGGKSDEPISRDIELFESVQLDAYKDATNLKWRIKSDFINGEWVAISDYFEATSDKSRYRHLGRTDRIVKYASRRLDLDEYENRLNDAYPDLDFLCMFEPSVDSAKGGDLIVSASAESEALQDMLSKFVLCHTDLPLPTKFASRL